MNKISDMVGIPKDVSSNLPLIRIVGREEFYIENYRGILEYQTDKILIQTKVGQIYLGGKNLQIDYYTNEEMKVTGRIDVLEYH